MRKSIITKFLFFLLLTSNFLTAQNYIKAVCKLNSGATINGLIKNSFKTDDEFIFFKENDQNKKINIKDIETLLIDGKEEYISKIVYFHPNRLLTVQQINDSKTTDLKERQSKQVLLKFLVQGAVNLYQTNIGGKPLYYYSKINERSLEYLEHYNYLTEANIIKVNNLFQRALVKDVNCNNQINTSIRNINYEEKDLVDVVNKHNICVNGASKIVNGGANNQTKFRLHVFGGVKIINGIIENSAFISKNKISDSNLSPNFGAEFSYILGDRNMKSEFFTRVDHSRINFSKNPISVSSSGVTTYEENIQFESSVIGVLLGYRYNFNSLRDTTKNNFALDLGINSSLPMNSSYIYKNRLVGTNDFGAVDLSDTVSNNLVFGLSVGTSYTFLQKYTLEARYTFSSNYMDQAQNVKAEFSNLNIGFKYLILD